MMLRYHVVVNRRAYLCDSFFYTLFSIQGLFYCSALKPQTSGGTLDVRLLPALAKCRLPTRGCPQSAGRKSLLYSHVDQL